MREILGKISDWLSRHVTSGDKDYGTGFDVPTVPREDPGAELAEQFTRLGERVDTLKDAGEALAHGIHNPVEGFRDIERMGINHQFGTPGLIVDDLQHDHHMIVGDVGLGLFGLLRNVLAAVLGRMIMAPERDREPPK